jgi:hypothetical protein
VPVVEVVVPALEQHELDGGAHGRSAQLIGSLGR